MYRPGLGFLSSLRQPWTGKIWLDYVRNSVTCFPSKIKSTAEQGIKNQNGDKRVRGLKNSFVTLQQKPIKVSA